MNIVFYEFCKVVFGQTGRVVFSEVICCLTLVFTHTVSQLIYFKVVKYIYVNFLFDFLQEWLD